MNVGSLRRRNVLARNTVQFQKRLSEPTYEHLYGTAEQCRAVVVASRGPDGFTCPVCGGREHSQVKSRGRLQFTACRRQTSPIAGTICASTKLALHTWFRAMYHVTQTKQGISSIELGRRDADHGLEGQAQAQTGHAGARRVQAVDRTGRDRRRVSRRRTFRRQVRARSGGKDAVRRPGRDQPGWQAGPHQTGAGQRFLQSGTVGVRQALPRPKLFGRQRRASVFHQRPRCRMHPPGNQDRRWCHGSAQRGVQVGQHGPRQHQGRDCRYLPIHQRQARPAPLRRVRVSLQPVIRSRRHAAAPLLGQRADHPLAISAPQIG